VGDTWDTIVYHHYRAYDTPERRKLLWGW